MGSPQRAARRHLELPRNELTSRSCILRRAAGSVNRASVVRAEPQAVARSRRGLERVSRPAATSAAGRARLLGPDRPMDGSRRLEWLPERYGEPAHTGGGGFPTGRARIWRCAGGRARRRANRAGLPGGCRPRPSAGRGRCAAAASDRLRATRDGERFAQPGHLDHHRDAVAGDDEAVGEPKKRAVGIIAAGIPPVQASAR